MTGPQLIPATSPSTGLDKAVNRLRDKLTANSLMPYLDRVYGLAQIISEREDDGGIRKIPGVYNEGLKKTSSYQVCFPNDAVAGFAFFFVNGEVSGVDDFEDSHGAPHKMIAPVSLIVNGNLRKVAQSQGYDVHRQAQNVLQIYANQPGLRVTSYIADPIEDVFEPFDVRAIDEALVMWPYFSIRFNLTVAYTPFDQSACN